jgi:hypothetical protein
MSTDANSLSSLSFAQELLGTEKISVSVCLSDVGRIAANNIDICLSVYLSHTGIAANNIDLCNVCVSLSRRNSCCQHRSVCLSLLSLRRRNWRRLEHEPRMSRLPAHLMQNLLLALSSTNTGVHCKTKSSARTTKKKKKQKKSNSFVKRKELYTRKALYM